MCLKSYFREHLEMNNRREKWGVKILFLSAVHKVSHKWQEKFWLDFPAVRSGEHRDRSPQKLFLEILKTRLARSPLSVRRTNLALRCENGAGGLSPSQCWDDVGKISSAPK